jgi:hypothetical protein
MGVTLRHPGARLEASVAGMDNAWEAGWSGSLNGPSPLIARWNGTAWKSVPIPAPASAGQLSGVAAISARDAWAVGHTFSPEPTPVTAREQEIPGTGSGS